MADSRPVQLDRALGTSRRRPTPLAAVAVVGGALLALLLLNASAAGAQEEEIDLFDNEYCLGCHQGQNLSTTFPNGEILRMFVDPAVYAESVHGQLEIPCVLCHTNITPFPHEPIEIPSVREYTLSSNEVCANCHVEQFTQTADNVHSHALEAGNQEAAVCTDCHGAHDTRAPVGHSPEVPLTCRECHLEIYDLYELSVHGEALETGNGDVPTCTDCHGVHEVDGPEEDSPFHLFSPQICAECHADDDLMGQYGISTAVFETYIADFHGETIVLFEELAPDQETNKPVCIDCHGVHAIKSADDPTATTFSANVLQTCQRCHPDATENFPESWLSHYIPDPDTALVVWLVQWFYRILIPLVIGGLGLYVILNWIRRAVDSRKARAHG